MTRFSKTAQLTLLLCVAVGAASPALAFTNPFTEVSAKWCVGEATDMTKHFPAQVDKCRNGAVDSGWWTDEIEQPQAGSTVQLDLFMSLRNQVLSTYGISMRYDVEGSDLLDFQALSVYNLRSFYPIADITCAPLGDSQTVDGGCEELGGDGLIANQAIVVERDMSNQVVSRQIYTNPPSIDFQPVVESTEGLAGFVYSFTSLSVADTPIFGTSLGQGGPSQVRFGSVWFTVGEPAEEIGASARLGLFKQFIDVLIDGELPNPGILNPIPDTEWATAVVWKGATIPEPGVALMHFSVLAAVGLLSRRRR